MANFFQNLLKGITRPVRDVAEMENLYQTALSVKRTPETTKSGFSQLKKYQPKYTDINEAQQLISNPLLQGSKDIASVGAYLTPVGQGIKGLAGTGALSGGLGGFGSSQQGQELSGTLGGAAMGGALGALLGIGQKAVSKIKPGLQKAQNQVEESLLTGVTPKKLNMSPEQVARAKRTYINTFKEVKGSQIGFGKEELANAKDDVISALSGEVDKLSGVPLEGAKQSVLNQARQKVDLALLSKTANKTGGKSVKDILQAVDTLGDAPTVGELRNIYQKIDDVVNYKSTGGIKTSGAVNLDRELSSLRKIIRGELPKQVDDALGKLSDAIKVGDQLKDITSKQSRINVAGTSIPVPGGAVNASEKALTGILSGAEQLAPQTGVGVEALGNILKGLVAVRPAQQEEAPTMEAPQLDSVQRPQGIDFIQALGMASQIFPDASESELLSLAGELQKQYGGGTQAKKTDLQRKAGSAIKSIDDIELLLQEGKGVLWKQLIPFQGFDSKAQIFDTAQKNIYDALARMRTGAVINASEEKLYRSFVPQVQDTPERIQYKISQLKNIFSTISGGEGVPSVEMVQ